MKKILLSSAALALFSISMLIFQISCKKDAIAQTGGLTQQNIIFYVKNFSPADTFEYWLANLDGANQHKVNITLGANVVLRGEARLSPDGTKIIFTAQDSSTGIDAVYSVAIAGGAATKIIDGVANARIYLNGVN